MLRLAQLSVTIFLCNLVLETAYKLATYSVAYIGHVHNVATEMYETILFQLYNGFINMLWRTNCCYSGDSD